jgi:hypothetical protein
MKYAAVVICSLLTLTSGCQQFRSAAASEDGQVASSTAIEKPDAGVEFFRDRLARVGEWVDTADYGPCWYPTQVGASWRPYTNGRWVYTVGSGWLWIGNERWGWATDHYGRWIFLDSHGWVWVPGKQWAPAWVVWRAGNGYVGWAPMPPIKRGREEQDPTRVDSKNVDPISFTFVADNLLADEHLAAQLEPLTRNVTLLERTEDATRYQVADERFFNGGVAAEAIDRAAEKPITRYHVVEVNTLRPPEIRGEDVLVYRPNVDEAGEALLAGTSVGPPQAPPRPRDPTAEMSSSQRLALDEYHRQMLAEMDKRQTAELAATPAAGRADLAQRHARERTAFADQLQREIEALRRRQLDERERFTARQPKRSQTPLSPDAAQATHYELPPEWQLPPEYMEPPPRRPARLPGR